MTSLLVALLLAGCDTTTPPATRTPLVLDATPPVAGMAQGVLDLPVGAPLGGFSSRCNYLGGSSRVDERQTPYNVGFVPSTGVHTPAEAQVLWLEAGGQALLLARIDAIYSYDGFVDELEARLTADTGVDMHGRVVVATSHSHHAVADYTKQEGFFLGGDRYDEEIFQRIVGGLEDLALQAWDSRVDAAIGVGMATDWDPDDRVYRDRRGENNELGFFDDIPDGSYKDPNLWLLRVDTADGEPLGFFYTFGMHGTSLSEDNPLQSKDSVGGVNDALRERFDTPLVIGHLQGGGGDASPAGSDDGFARLETIGEYGADAIADLWAATPTSTAPLTLESVSRGIDMDRDGISVTRPYGTLTYAPYDDSPEYSPDNLVYADDGTLLTPIDEFNAPYGAVFCGYDDPLLSSGTIGADVFPYDGCMDIELISSLVFGIFQMDVEQMEMPLPHTTRALATAVRLGPVDILEADGSETSDDVLLGFFPGETTSLYSEQFRRRTRAEVGFEHVLPVGYAQDHEGYLLIPEDWLVGGYEPNITFWGPLGAEHIMEGVLAMADERLTTDLLEPDDPLGLYPSTTYDDWALGSVPPDPTPDAGTWVDAAPESLWTPLLDAGLSVDVAPPAEVRRVQDVVQIVWNGGDPMVDSPRVVLERQDGDAWVPVQTRSGRAVGSDLTDVLLAWQPDPLYPADAEQTHTWWAAWQPVSWGGDDRAGLPLGSYRLHVTGRRALDGGSTWPWPADSYELTTDAFEVLPAELTVVAGDGTISAAVEAPAWGWRLVDLDGSSHGANPLTEPELQWELADGSTQDAGVDATISAGWSVFAATAPPDAVAAIVTDAWGNTGRIEL